MSDSNFLNFNCLAFDPKVYSNIKIKMLYSSIHSWVTEDLFRLKVKHFKNKYGDKFYVGLGVLDVGINKNEKIINTNTLERDLRICKELGVKEVVIYRLGGLNKDYLNVIKKYSK